MTVGLRSPQTDANALRGMRRELINEDIERRISVAADEVSGFAVKGDIAAISTERGRIRIAVGFGAVWARADALGRSRLAVVDENVGPEVGVAGDQVAGLAVKGDEAAVGADRGRIGIAVRVSITRTDADAL